MRRAVIAVALATWLAGSVQAQRTSVETAAQNAPPAQHRTRLILKDGSYQLVLSYQVTGKTVRYKSAERGGNTEEIPLDLVDLDATRRWEQRHMAALGQEPAADGRAPVIDPELAKEEADRLAIEPEVAPDLHLAADATVLALDTFHGGPELVPLVQTDGSISKQTGHNIFKSAINPLAATHQIVVLKGEKAPVQMHVDEPVLYVKLDDALPTSGEALTVDTHGASSDSSRKRPQHAHDYVIVRLDVRQDARVVASFSTSALGGSKRQEDVFETTTTVLPGGHWMKIQPRETLLIGEYALVEVLGENQLNLGVWDFGVHPTAPENRDVLKPEKRRPVELERRRRGDQ